MKKFFVCGLGNALIDIFIDLDDETFRSLDLEKGSMRLAEREEQEHYIASLASKELPRVSGGSVANSVIAFAQLGGKAALLASVAEDANGSFYKHECDTLDISFPITPIEGRTGTSLIFITPDAERTMRTHLGVSSLISGERLSEETIAQSEWLFIEGYIFANPEYGHGAASRAIEVAKAHGTKIAITLSESWVVEAFRDVVERAIEDADLVFANEMEVKAYGKSDDFEKAFNALSAKVPHVVGTRGPLGVEIRVNGEDYKVEAYPCEPVDLTGAGDMLAGGYLYGISAGLSYTEAAKRACYLCSKVICVTGARLHGDIKNYWNNSQERVD